MTGREHHNVSRKRHIAKAITWRIVATTTTFVLAWAVTGSIEVGAAIGGMEATTKMFLYYLHERAWYRFDYGILEASEQEEVQESS